MITRYFKMQYAENESVFLFGARQTGKTTFLNQLFPEVRYYDLLKADVFERLNRHPELLREELLSCAENEHISVIPTAKTVCRIGEQAEAWK